MKFLAFIAFTVFSAILLSNPACTAATATLTDMNSYYLGDIDLSDPQVSRRSAGELFGKKIKEQIPTYEQLIDSYLHEFLHDGGNYQEMLRRMEIIWPKVPEIIRDEVTGLAAGICSTDKNIPGDNLLSPDELKLFNLIPDIFRATNCSAIGVTPQASASGNLILSRNVDWDDGSTFQLSRLQSVVRYKLSADRDLTLISYLGAVVALTGYTSFHDATTGNNSIFFAVLDSDIGHAYSADNKRSYPADLRAYAEEADSIPDIAQKLTGTATEYTFGYLVFLADRTAPGVFEDNLTYAPSRLREVKDNAELYLPWKIPGTIGAVNCFMLKTSLNNTLGVDENRGTAASSSNLQAGDNTIYVGNVKRWATQQRLLAADGGRHSFTDLQKISGYGPGKATEGFIYRPSTQQIIVFEPATGRLEVAFHPVGRDLKEDEKPQYIRIPLPARP